DLGDTQATILLLSGQLTHALSRVRGDDVEPRGVRKEALQRRDRPRGNAAPAGRCSSTPSTAWLRRLSRRDVRLHAFDIGEFERTDLPAPEQRLDVRVDPAAVHGESRRLDRAIAAPKDAACLSFRQIPVAYFRDRDRVPGARALLGRIRSTGDSAELDLGLVAGLLDRQHPIAPDHDASAATLRISVLEDERLQT